VSDLGGSIVVIRTAVAADLPELQRVYRSASLSNAGDAPLLLARPEFLLFAGEGIASGRTRIAVDSRDGEGSALGFATVTPGPQADHELEDLFVDPHWQRRGIARQLISDAAVSARAVGCQRLSVTANPHASAFYSAVGFCEDDRATTPLGEGLRMHLDLT
jgi:GNAT superfamily N-acetyltransferase